MRNSRDRARGGEARRTDRNIGVLPDAVLPAIPRMNVLAQLAALAVADMPTLKAKWRELFGAEPPPFSVTYLRSRLAFRIQELAFGGVELATVERLEALGERLDGGNVTLRRTRLDDRPIAGTRLVREWNGVEHTVMVMIDGFAWEGRPYASLSAVARAITGTRWNGWTFFGLRSQRSDA